MRAVSRAVLAGHPLVAFWLVALRWLAWLLVGHPLGLLLFGGGLAIGLPVAWLPPAAVAVDDLAVLAASRGASSAGRLVWVWSQACRFRRRWPAALADASVRQGRDVSIIFSGNYYSTPDGLRPVLAAPRLSMLPSYAFPASVTWAVRPYGTHSFGELHAQVRRLAAVDPRIVDAGMEDERDRLGRWQLTVTFASTAAGAPDHEFVGPAEALLEELSEERADESVDGPGPGDDWPPRADSRHPRTDGDLNTSQQASQRTSRYRASGRRLRQPRSRQATEGFRRAGSTTKEGGNDGTGTGLE